MEQIIKDPNRSDRWGYVIVGVVICALAITLTLLDTAMLPVTCIAVVTSLMVSGMGMLGRPYVVLDRKGVTYRLLFRKKFFQWDEVVQVGIRNTKSTRVPVEYLFPFVIVLPGPFRYSLLRDLFQSLLVPNRPEIRKFVAENYGPLDFDDTNGLNNWEKQYYGFKRKP